MRAPHRRSTVHTHVAVTIAAALQLAACGKAIQFLVTTRELQIVQRQVDAVAGTTGASVTLRDRRVLTITLGNDDRPKPTAAGEQLLRRVAVAAYLAFPSRSQVEAVVVENAGRTETQQFRPIQLIQPGELTEHWAKPFRNPNYLYFVGVGGVRSDLVPELASHFQQTLGLDIEALPAVPFDPITVDQNRSQVVAEELIAAIRRRYPALARDPHARIIGVTGDDMFLRSMAGSWSFGFSWRSDDDRMAVVSYARMDPAALGLSPDPDMLRSRVTKMVANDIGVLYYGLPLSNNPRSVLYANIGGTDELDLMTEYFDPRPATSSSR